MTVTVAEPPAVSAPPRRAAWLPWAIALIATLPLLWCWSDFRAMFWFGDEWDQLDQISHQGFRTWSLSPFGENVAPVFKLTWGGLALASHGSYLFMLAAVWCVHLVCVVLLGRWMLKAGFGAVAIAAVLLVFGLAETNLETLAWTIQLITVQGMTLFLAAAQWHDSHERTGRWTAANVAVLTGLIALGTFSFARGPLVGTTLAAVTVLPLLASAAGRLVWRRRLVVGLACFLPALIAVMFIVKYAPGNHQHLATVGLRAPALFGAGYFFMNPFYNFGATWGWTERTILYYGLGKAAVLILGWLLASPSQRRLLLPLILFDAGNAVLMGIGRSNELLLTATSSRYQYISLVCTLPFVAPIIESLLRRVSVRWALRPAIAALLLVSVAWLAVRPWPRELHGWANWRGRDTREVLFRNPNPPAERAIPGIPFLRTDRAKELVREYNLH